MGLGRPILDYWHAYLICTHYYKHFGFIISIQIVNRTADIRNKKCNSIITNSILIINLLN